MRLFSLCVTLAALGATAQGKPTLIDHPVEVKFALTEAQLTALQDGFRQLLAKSSAIRLPTRTNWKAAMAALKRQDCDLRNECLQQLATTAGTLYALYAFVERNAAGTELTAAGRVVNQDGVQVRPLTQVTIKRKGSFDEAAREALRLLVAQLELDKLSPVLTPPAVEPKPASVVVEQPTLAPPLPLPLPPPPLPPNEPAAVASATAPSPPPPAGVSALRVVAYVTGATALAAAALTVGFGATAASERARLPTAGLLLDDSQVRL